MAFTLQILHASDQEAGVPALQDAIGLSAVMNALQDDFQNTIKLTSGDVYIASPFFNASSEIYDSATTGRPAGQPGLADILIQNELGWDAAAVGNHEFTGGDTTFLSLLAPNPTWVNGALGGTGIGTSGYPGALFPYLANNLNFSAATLPTGLSVVPNGGAALPNTLTGSVTVDVNGTPVGVLGVVTPYLPSIANIGRVQMTTGSGFTSASPVSEQVDAVIANLQPAVQDLTNRGVNKIVLMTHLQESRIEQALAQRLADLGLAVDVHIGGGSHQVMASGAGVPPLRQDETQQLSGQLLQPYPQAFTSGNNTVYYVNTGANYRYLSQLVATFDDNGTITEIGGTSGTFATDIAGVDRLYADDITTFAQVRALADPDVVAIVDGVGAFVNELDSIIYGQTDVFLNGIRADVRTQETNLGSLGADANDFYAEAYLTAYSDALLPGFNAIDISFRNGGGIRDQIGLSFIPGGGGDQVQLPPPANPNVGKEEGDISRLDITNSLRFDNALSVGTITAAGLYDTAEHMVALAPAQAGQFGQIGGFKFSFDPTAPGRTATTPGQRIQNLVVVNEDGSIKDTVVQNGSLVGDPSRNFSVVTLSFLTTGGDSYPNVLQNLRSLSDFAEPASVGRAGLQSGREQDAFAEYLAATFNVANGQAPFAEADTPPSLDERIQNLAFREDTILNGSNGGGVTRIFEIQGAGDRSPLEGQVVTTTGVVTADFRAKNPGNFAPLRGVFIQDATGDRNPLTSDGLFLFLPGPSVFANTSLAIGDVVQVTGTVTENSASRAPSDGRTLFTHLDFITDLAVTGKGTITPTDVRLPEATDGDLERFESMLVNIASEMTVSQNFFVGRYGQLTLASPDDAGDPGRLFQPTNQFRPLTTGAIDLAEANSRRLLILDDGQDNRSLGDNPTTVPFLGAPPPAVIRAGDRVENLVGVIDFGRINSSSTPALDYRLQPLDTESVSFKPENPRPEVPEAVGGSLQVAAFNVLNYFTTLRSQDSNARGAFNEEEFIRQRTKLFAAFEQMDADIVGLIEIENNGFGPDSAIQDFVDGLNAIVGAGTYAFITAPSPSQTDGRLGTDAITNGIIYKPATVRPIGNPAILDKTVDPRFDSDNQRPTLAQTFQEIATGEVFTFANNHFKSKSGPPRNLPPGQDPNPGDLDLGDGQGESNFTRLRAARALVSWLETDPTGSGDRDFLIVGDLNAYALEDPIIAIQEGADGLAGTADDYTNLIRRFVGENAYSFIFNGQSGYLDHALASSSLTQQVTGVTEWNINADEPDVIGYSTGFNSRPYFAPDAFRSSDHDPVIVGLNLSSRPSGQRTYLVSEGESLVVNGFGGVGRGATPTAAAIAETDTIRLTGAQLTARNLLLTQVGADLQMTFEGSRTQIELGNFALENLENLRRDTGASVDLGNLLFNGQTRVQDSFDVFNAEWNFAQIFNRDSVTFLNDLDNTIAGFDRSNDVINGQGGNDSIRGLSGDDLLRGGSGNDTLIGGLGNDTVVGGNGADVFVLAAGEGTDTISDLSLSQGDRIGLSGITFAALTIAQGAGSNSSNAIVSLTTTNEVLAVVTGVQATTLTSAAFVPFVG
ncbi:MAG: ExeM/NucH family extracellular endonuclease [Leptolyngbyaceae cyanobacterium bins.349]|nr:ExeM/NucH family extracellular endonuclease [Leptolyngbyaceae cyanobacterium bins.349]